MILVRYASLGARTHSQNTIAKCICTFIWSVFLHKHTFHLFFDLLLSFCPLLLWGLSLYHLFFIECLPFFFHSKESIRHRCAKRLLALLLYCDAYCFLCLCEREQKCVCKLTYVCSFFYCKFSSKLLRASKGLLSAEKCHINSHTRKDRHTHWTNMAEWTSSTIYLKCRH